MVMTVTKLNVIANNTCNINVETYHKEKKKPFDYKKELFKTRVLISKIKQNNKRRVVNTMGE